MNDAAVRDLARRAGIAVEWTDYANKRRRVPLETIRHILIGLKLPCATASDVAYSRRALEEQTPPPLVTMTAGQPLDLPIAQAGARALVRLVDENGNAEERRVPCRRNALRLAGLKTPGYLRVELGQTTITLAVAPRRCATIADIAPGQRLWGLAAQTYGLRSAGDCGIGDMAGVGALAAAAAAVDADALALSPLHALLAREGGQYSPYSPSSRLFYNPLHADAAAVFGRARVAKARSACGADGLADELQSYSQIDWARASRVKMSIFRQLFEDFSTSDLGAASASALAADFARFRDGGGLPLQQHALFEALHAARLKLDQPAWSWRNWPAQWRNPRSAAVKSFAEENERQVLFQSFLQWLAERSYAAAQQRARQSGMRIGLIADLAVGIDSGGSDAWNHQDELLGDLEIGAPPDLFNANGQNWGLTTFSPRALARTGFALFLAAIRACLRHSGGIRVDHAMGFARLWLIPRGAAAREGAYVRFPVDDLLRLIALETYRQRAIAIGEDLGTVPAGFRRRLAGSGIYGMRVLWFERRGRRFTPPTAWPVKAAAMTSTHDLPTVAGWWTGTDIETRARCGLAKNAARDRTARTKERQALWRALRAAKASNGNLPSPDEARRIADAVVKFLARTPSRIALLPLEDALALQEQPNLPGTIHEHPNWRRRYNGQAGELLEPADVRKRIRPLAGRKA